MKPGLTATYFYFYFKNPCVYKVIMPQVFASDAEVNIVTLQCHDGNTQTTKTNLKEKKKCLYAIETSGIPCINENLAGLL